MPTLIRLTLLCCIIWMQASSAQARYQLEPYKDSLFRYPGLLSGTIGDPFLIVDYDKYRDIHRRDKILERKVHGEYVSLYPESSQNEQEIKVGGRTIKYIRVGENTKNPKAVVIYIHGQGGDRFQGANDWMFGGNFNRIKNLMARNGGLYISPDFTDFGAKGEQDIKAIMRRYAARNPNTPIFVACGSMGGFLCWRLAEDPQAAKMMGGMLLLGSTWNNDFFKTSTFRSGKLPIYFGHGSWDKVYDWRKQAKFFTRLKERAPNYPAKFTLFETGSHGTPIRMTDWRLVLNWMLAAGGR